MRRLLTNASGWTTLAAMSLGYGVVQLDVTIVNVALNSIGSSVGGSVAGLQWVVSAYTITFAAFILTAGALGDRIGAKRVFTVGFGLFGVASLGCAVAPSLGLLIGARAIQGVGAAILVPNSLALLNYAYQDDKERGRAVGIWAAGASIALTAGPLVGGTLIAAIGWRAIFLVNVPIALCALAMAWRSASETPTAENRQLDLGGQTTGILAVGCLAAALIEGGALGWNNPWVVAGLVASGVATALLIGAEQHARQPMLPLELFRSQRFSVNSADGLLVNVAFYGLIFVFSLYFQQVSGLQPFWTGLAFVPMMGAVFPANLLAPRLSERIGARATMVIGQSIAGLGCLGLLGLQRGTPYWFVVPQLVAMGFGLGLLVPPLTSTLLSSVDKAHSGVASGVLNSMRQTGSVLGVALFGSLVATSADFVSGARVALLISSALLLVGSLMLLVGARPRALTLESTRNTNTRSRGARPVSPRLR
jgi:MFS transporter, DHA2 family, methylenomycin A resistance protein